MCKDHSIDIISGISDIFNNTPNMFDFKIVNGIRKFDYILNYNYN